MTYFDDIYDQAADNYGFITTAEARALGVPGIEVVKMAQRGKLDRVGYGVYRLNRYYPTEFDAYAQAVALVGDGAYIYGESVLAMLNLALVNPSKITVATPARVRKTLPAHIKVVAAKPETKVTRYECIPSQTVADAIRTCKKTIMAERLLPAIENARLRGLVGEREATELKKEIRNAHKATKQPT
ncbi:MAG: type IV toxin-antitoxin system AbiEi family antitoxin domain-containing protein [Coriobacteriales bacterium]|jgi:predicted transcriptional regulator of viral defense system|nr:type IV toxin-antitoxin system AbiEi family antitoxin domain-containing protein [Coriobacteriales bacterium]